jgi:hypothetical protein
LLPQTLIDRGSGLNVIFVDTLKKMDFDFKRSIEYDEPFFSIVPGKAAYPMVESPFRSHSARRRTSARSTLASRSLSSNLPTTPS